MRRNGIIWFESLMVGKVPGLQEERWYACIRWEVFSSHGDCQLWSLSYTSSTYCMMRCPKADFPSVISNPVRCLVAIFHFFTKARIM